MMLSGFILKTLVLCIILGLPAFSIFMQDSTSTPNWIQQLDALQHEAAQNGWTVATHSQSADLWHRLDQPRKAAAHWEALLMLQPDQPDILRNLADFYITEQRWTDAVDTLRRVLELAPDSERQIIELGLILASFNPQEALNILQPIVFGPEIIRDVMNLINASPDGDLDLIELGLTFGDHDRWDLAELAFRQAVNTGTTFPESFAYIGLARVYQGKSAEHWFGAALAEAPESAQIWYLLGTYYREQRNFDQALNSLAYGFSLDQSNPFFTVQMGEIYEEIGNLTLAEFWFNQARNMSDDATINERVNRFYADNAAMLSAVESLERLPQIATDLTPDIRASLGWLLYRSGNEDTGLAEIDKALEQAPETPEALYYKANILIDRNQLDEAQALLTQVAEGDSSFKADAQLLLDRVYP